MRDRYTITERLAAGGQAEVFRGISESIEGFKKAVAIKRILPELGKNPKFVSMFLDEARLSLFLQHANVVHVFDISRSADDAYFLVMELVDGCDLKALANWHVEHGKRIEVAHALYIMIEACKGLDYAHHLEHPSTRVPLHIVHRDVSPANILLSKSGEVKMVDFGLAKATSQAESTDPGVVKGKFGYLSPEAAFGKEIDHRTDVFAVGIILWELLTMERLFRGETDWGTIELVRAANIPFINRFNPKVDDELEGIVRRALARDAGDRYQSAGDLGDALSMYLYEKRMKVTSNDIAKLVKDVKKDVDAARRAEAAAKGVRLTQIGMEVANLESLVDEGGGEMVDPNAWFSGGLDE